MDALRRRHSRLWRLRFQLLVRYTPEHSEFDGIMSSRLKRPLETAVPGRPMVWPLALMEKTDARRRLSSCAPPNFNLNAEDAKIKITEDGPERTPA